MMLFLIDDVLLYYGNLLHRVGESSVSGAMAGNISMSVGVQLPLMLLIDGGNAAISAENDVVNEIGLTHDEAKVALISGSITRTPQ